MYITPISNYNVSMNGAQNNVSRGSNSMFIKNIKQKLLNIFPIKTFNDDKKKLKKWSDIDTLISKPAENRLIMGATAIVTQPVIDYYNPRVDKDTRTVSRNRTIAKIIAGTTIGMIVRGSVYKIVEKMTDINASSENSKKLLPQKYMKEFIEDVKILKNYRGALSTIIALLTMLLTNIIFDAPATTKIANKLNELSGFKHTNDNLEVKKEIQPEVKDV